MNRSKRKVIAQQTLKILEDGFYYLDGVKIDIGESVANSIQNAYTVAPEESPRDLPLAGERFDTRVSVENETTFRGVRQMMARGYQNVTCLNFASAKNPGGGFLNGSQAQEEALSRASSLYPTLRANSIYYETNRAHRNALYTDYMIFSPGVVVFRDDEDELLAEPYPVNVITAPAVNAGAVHKNHPGLVEKIESVMLKRIERVIHLALAEETDAIVLGAWGCGVFRNDPAKMASWFQTVLESETFAGRFKAVRFSVLDRKDSGLIYPQFESCFA